MMFKKQKNVSNQQEKESGQLNPYLSARREWNERYGEYIARERLWRLIAIICLLVTGISVGGVVYIGSQSRFVPYVVQVDKLGRPLSVGPAEKMKPVDTRVLRSMVASFIVNVRSVSADAAVLYNAINKAYSMLADGNPAKGQMNEYFRNSENDPFNRAKTESVAIQIESVFPVSENSWEVEWTEIIRSPDGKESARISMKATMETYISPPTDENDFINNPIGLFIKEFSWTKRF